MITLLIILIVAILLFGAAAVTSFLSAVAQRVVLVILFLAVCLFSISYPYLLFSAAIFVGGLLIGAAVEKQQKRTIERLSEERSSLMAAEPKTKDVELRLSELNRKLAPHDRKTARYLEQQKKAEAALATRLGVEKVGNEYCLKK